MRLQERLEPHLVARRRDPRAGEPEEVLHPAVLTALKEEHRVLQHGKWALEFDRRRFRSLAAGQRERWGLQVKETAAAVEVEQPGLATMGRRAVPDRDERRHRDRLASLARFAERFGACAVEGRVEPKSLRARARVRPEHGPALDSLNRSRLDPDAELVGVAWRRRGERQGRHCNCCKSESHRSPRIVARYRKYCARFELSCTDLQASRRSTLRPLSKSV